MGIPNPRSPSPDCATEASPARKSWSWRWWKKRCSGVRLITAEVQWSHENSQVVFSCIYFVSQISFIAVQFPYKFLYWNGIKWGISCNTARYTLHIRGCVLFCLCSGSQCEFERTQEVEGRLRVTDIEYDDQFDDKNSKEFMIFNGRFVEQVCLEYSINPLVL